MFSLDFLSKMSRKLKSGLLKLLFPLIVGTGAAFGQQQSKETLIKGSERAIRESITQFNLTDGVLYPNLLRDGQNLRDNLSDPVAFSSYVDSMDAHLRAMVDTADTPLFRAQSTQDIIDQNIKYLMGAAKGYDKLKTSEEGRLKAIQTAAPTERRQYLPTEVRESLAADETALRENINHIKGLVGRIKDVVKYTQSTFSTVRDFEDPQNFDFNSDDNHSGFVDFMTTSFRDLESMYAEHPELLEDAVAGILVPYATSTRTNIDDILDDYISPRKMRKLLGEDSATVQAIYEARADLKNTSKDLKRIAKGKMPKSKRVRVPKVSIPEIKLSRLIAREERETPFGIIFGGYMGNDLYKSVPGSNELQGLEVGARYGPFAGIFSVSWDADENILEITTPTAPNGVYGHIRKDHVNFKSVGLAGEVYLGSVFAGGGFNYLDWGVKSMENTMKNGQVITPHENTSPANDVSGKVYGGLQSGHKRRFGVSAFAGYDTMKGFFSGARGHFYFNKGSRSVRKSR